MKIELMIELCSVVIMGFLLVKFVPIRRLRESFVIFAFVQIITWLLGVCIVELHLIEYPIRLFPYSTKTSFTFEYFTLPGLCVLFNLYFPEKKSRIYQRSYYLCYCLSLTILEAILEKYTDVISYTGWTWYMSFVGFYLTFFFSRKFYLWYFSNN